jgi:hypothetical protein
MLCRVVHLLNMAARVGDAAEGANAADRTN